tara:strand:- start:160 stop:579 length:420 start_codon:yes stop_codon:yes gene_type:complete
MEEYISSFHAPQMLLMDTKAMLFKQFSGSGHIHRTHRSIAFSISEKATTAKEFYMIICGPSTGLFDVLEKKFHRFVHISGFLAGSCIFMILSSGKNGMAHPSDTELWMPDADSHATPEDGSNPGGSIAPEEFSWLQKNV